MSTNPFDLLSVEESGPTKVGPKVFADPAADPTDISKDDRAVSKGPKKHSNAPPTKGSGKRDPKRPFDRHSGTGRSYELKRQGGGKYNVGTDADLIEENVAPEAVPEPVASPNPEEEQELEQPVQKRTLEEYFAELQTSTTEVTGRQQADADYNMGQVIHKPKEEYEYTVEEVSPKKGKAKGVDVTEEFTNWFRAPRVRGGRGGRGRGFGRGGRRSPPRE
ncbi:hypothetical protein P9112_007866 [Eukaryota sp. TZLM1-RC]